MRLPDAIAPYASLIKWMIVVSVFCAVFIGGCHYGTGRQFTKDKEAIDKADARANANAAQAAILAGTLGQIDTETAEREASAKAEVRRAKDAAARAEQAAKKFQAELSTIERDIASAKRNPTCRKALEERVCAALH